MADEAHRHPQPTLGPRGVREGLTMLAYATNGEPVLFGHGAPLRLRTEIQLGCKMVKGGSKGSNSWRTSQKSAAIWALQQRLRMLRLPTVHLERERSHAKSILARIDASATGDRPRRVERPQRPYHLRWSRTHLRQTMVAHRAGSELHEHENPGEATVQVLHGRVTLIAHDVTGTVRRAT